MQDLPHIEQLHTSVFKRFLNVSLHSFNTILYGETGRYPLYINHKLKCIKYWFQLLHMSNERLPLQAYKMLERLSESGTRTWVSDVRDTLCANGFGYVWLFRNVGDVDNFCIVFKERLIDNFKQNWYQRVSSNSHLEFYSSFKSMIITESFLFNNVFQRHIRNSLVRFRFGVSDILCHRLKFSKTSLNQTLCPLCHNERENEFHVVFICT